MTEMKEKNFPEQLSGLLILRCKYNHITRHLSKYKPRIKMI